MLNVELVTLLKPVAVNLILAPVTAAVLVAVRLVNADVPPTAVILVLPPRLQVAWFGAAVITAALDTALPDASVTITIGWVANALPLRAGAFGCVDIASFAGIPAMTCVTVFVLKPVALMTMVFEPGLCSSADCDGSNTISPVRVRL